jgi:hypothetical protein
MEDLKREIQEAIDREDSWQLYLDDTTNPDRR